MKPDWVKDSLVKHRLATTRQYSPDPTQFFHDVILTCGNLPECDEDAIIAGVIALGGQYSPHLTKIVTHIVTTDMTNDKCKLAQEKRLNIDIVLPHWFDDCLRLGKKISEGPYLLPDAELLSNTAQQPVRIGVALAVQGASDPRPEHEPGSPISPSKHRRGTTAFRGKTVILAPDLGINTHLKESLATLIRTAGGSVVMAVGDADIYIGHYRESDEFVEAFRLKKVIGNLSWLYHVLNRNRWTNPTTKLLHYPTPRNGIKGFQDMRISVSNYSGDARNYVQNLIQECGAEFTKTMRQDNTHLITAHKVSEKCDAAQEWNIDIINHLWLEESYAKCEVQTLTNSRYTHFPSRTNLGEVCGQVGIDIATIEAVYVASRLTQRKKAIEVHRDIEENPVTSSDPVDDEHVEEVEAYEIETDPVARSSKTPRRRSDEKENESPFLASSGRSSKLKALGVLHRQADDIRLFEKEMKRKGGVVYGGRKAEGERSSPVPAERGLKRHADADSSGISKHAEPISSGDHIKLVKRHKAAHANEPKSSTLPPIKYRLMLSGDDRWTQQPQQESKDKIKLRQHGILLTQDPKAVDILVAPKMLRTRKFVTAIASAPQVVDTHYLDDILQDEREVDDIRLLEDKATEKAWGFKLSDALARAQINKHRLFRGWEIYVTDHMPGGFDTYKDIISVNGGNALAFRGSRRGTTLKRRLALDPAAGEESQNQGGEEEYDYVYLVANNTPADKPLWKQFRKLAIEQELRPRVVKADWLLLSALSQRIQWDPEWKWNAE